MKRKLFWLGLFGTLTSCLLLTAFIGWLRQSGQTREAPETEKILQAQANLPFQILIPAYLPSGFKRAEVVIDTTAPGPQGQEMVRLVYSHPIGVNLTLYEWQLETSAISSTVSTTGKATACHCMCSGSQCSTSASMIDFGSLHIMGETSDPALLSPLHVQTILTTLGPASGLATYTTLEQLADSIELPPAEEVTINANGEQEIFLVVTPDGYEPAHVSVKKGIPVVLTFRQLGDVACGNEIYINWGEKEAAHLILSNPNDTQTVEFTPEKTGDFWFYCPYFHYQGVLTVTK